MLGLSNTGRLNPLFRSPCRQGTELLYQWVISLFSTASAARKGEATTPLLRRHPRLEVVQGEILCRLLLIRGGSNRIADSGRKLGLSPPGIPHMEKRAAAFPIPNSEHHVLNTCCAYVRGVRHDLLHGILGVPGIRSAKALARCSTLVWQTGRRVRRHACDLLVAVDSDTRRGAPLDQRGYAPVHAQASLAGSTRWCSDPQC